MVRSLSGGMTTAVNSLSRRPAITLTAQDHVLHYSSYQTPSNPDAWVDACVAPDGSIVRVQITRAGLTSIFQWQRITDPSQLSQWQTWSNLSGANILQDGGCAVSTNGSTIRAFCQRGTGGNNLWVWTSTNNGASWTGPVTVLSPPGGALTKGIGSAGNNDVFFLYDVLGGEAMGCSFFSGSWSALATWTLPTITNGSDVAPWFGSPGPTGVYTIVYSDGYALKSCTFNPSGSVWTALAPDIAPATSTAIGRMSPRVALDSTTGRLVCCVIEEDTGLITGSVYTYPRLRQSADLVHWSNGLILHGISTLYGANAFYVAAPQSGSSGARFYVATKGQVYSAPGYSAANATQFLDLSGAVLSYTRSEREGRPRRLDVVIDNNKGVYNALVNTGGSTTQPIGPNTSLVLSEGYYTGVAPGSPEVVQTGTYHLQQILFERSPHENQLRLIAFDLARNLDLAARYQMTYTNQTLSWLITEVCARAGFFSPVLPSTSQMSQSIPSFVLHAGQSYRAALDELISTYGLVWFLDQNETLNVLERAGSDPPVWTYAPEWELVSFGTEDLRANHLIISGKPPIGGQVGALTVAEAYDDANVTLVGLERLLHHTDTKLTTVAQCALKAGFLLSEEQRTQVAHHVTVPLNPALQLVDVISLTDAVAQGSGQSSTCRIIESIAHYDAQHAVYEMTLHLEGV